MDEPLSNLDAKLRVEMRTVIKDIQHTVGITTVYVTHDQEEAMAVSDRIAVMNTGVIQHVGTPKDIYQRPANLFVATFIGRSNVLDGELRMEDGKPVLHFHAAVLSGHAGQRACRGAQETGRHDLGPPGGVHSGRRMPPTLPASTATVDELRVPGPEYPLLCPPGRPVRRWRSSRNPPIDSIIPDGTVVQSRRQDREDQRVLTRKASRTCWKVSATTTRV